MNRESTIFDADCEPWVSNFLYPTIFIVDIWWCPPLLDKVYRQKNYAKSSCPRQYGSKVYCNIVG